MVETALVVLLMSAGVRHSTAVRVERLLDDHGRGGISGDWLAGCIATILRNTNAELSERLDQAETVCELAGWYKSTTEQEGGVLNSK
jgi:hypothetical protein